MSPSVRKGILVAVLQVAIVSSLGAQLMFDRAMRPRVWARAAPVDPNMPIRGRYVSLRIEAEIGPGLNLTVPDVTTMPDGRVFNTSYVPPTPVALAVRNDRLVALPTMGRGIPRVTMAVRAGQRVAVLAEPLAYFIPEHASDPSFRPAGEELWVEVTVPRSGAPRPIRLGVKKNGAIAPLE